jgi:hypothetical protein
MDRANLAVSLFASLSGELRWFAVVSPPADDRYLFERSASHLNGHYEGEVEIARNKDDRQLWAGKRSLTKTPPAFVFQKERTMDADGPWGQPIKA